MKYFLPYNLFLEKLNSDLSKTSDVYTKYTEDVKNLKSSYDEKIDSKINLPDFIGEFIYDLILVSKNNNLDLTKLVERLKNDSLYRKDDLYKIFSELKPDIEGDSLEKMLEDNEKLDDVLGDYVLAIREDLKKDPDETPKKFKSTIIYILDSLTKLTKEDLEKYKVDTTTETTNITKSTTTETPKPTTNTPKKPRDLVKATFSANRFDKYLTEKRLKVSKQEFLDGLATLAKNLSSNLKPEWFLPLIYIESGFRTNARNPDTNASGLLQLMPSNLKALAPEITPEQFREMDAVAQLEIFEKYFKQFSNKLSQVKDPADLYMLVAYPAAFGKSDDTVIGGEKLAKQNPNWVQDGNTLATVGGIRDYANSVG